MCFSGVSLFFRCILRFIGAFCGMFWWFFQAIFLCVCVLVVFGGLFLAHFHVFWGGWPQKEVLTWDIVNIAAIHQPVAVLGVAERRQVGGIGGTGSDVAPEAAWGRRGHGHGHHGVTKLWGDVGSHWCGVREVSED